MILVTGGAGSIGSNCILKLVERGYNVVAFDNLSTGKIETIQKLTSLGLNGFVEGDLLNPEQIWNVFCGNKIEAVIHCAEKSQIYEEKNIISKLYQNNVVGTLNLLDIMRRFHVDKIVFSSKLSISNNQEMKTVNDINTNLLLDTYSQTKFMCERIINDYSDNSSIKFAILRYLSESNLSIEDLSKSYVCALEYLVNGGNSDYFNIEINKGGLCKIKLM